MTSTNGTATATVQTLTAEVHVLQVGSRQITLSVAKQLDYVDLDEVEIFGRVKIWPRDNGIELIGRHIRTGALVVTCAVSGEPRWGCNTSVERMVELRALPLIVLAGLK